MKLNKGLMNRTVIYEQKNKANFEKFYAVKNTFNYYSETNNKIVNI